MRRRGVRLAQQSLEREQTSEACLSAERVARFGHFRLCQQLDERVHKGLGARVRRIGRCANELECLRRLTRMQRAELLPGAVRGSEEAVPPLLEDLLQLS
jgi:hypothetical protein